MEVHVSITGLCALVPSRDGRSVHVLFPRTGRTVSGEHVHPHDPVLWYSGINPKASDVRGFAADLSGLRPSGGSVPTLARMLDVAAVVGGGLDSGEVGPSPSSRVVGRVTLPLPDPGDVKEADTFVWTVVDSTGTAADRPLIHQIDWIIHKPREIAWERIRLRAPGAPPQAMGRPVPDTNDTLHLFVSHLPQQKHTVCKGQKASHAQAYYDLFGRSGKSPVLNDDPPDPACPRFARNRRRLQDAESAYNCMLGKAPAA